MSARAQSESIGVILLTAVVVITIGVAGGVVLANTGGDDTTRADLSVDVTDEGVAVVHDGGESVAFSELRVVVRSGSDRWQPTMNASGVVRGDDDGQFEGGERWVWRQSLDPSTVTTVQVVERASNTVLASDRHYPTARSPLTPDPSPNVALDSPEGGESYTGGETTSMEWRASGDDADVEEVRLAYSLDDGDSWTRVTDDPEDTGSYEWTLPEESSGEARVRVIAIDAENRSSRSKTGRFLVELPGSQSFDGQYNGDVYVEDDVTVEEGTINGNVTAGGDVVLDEDGTINGNITADGTIVVNEDGTVNGDTDSDGTVTVAEGGKINGDLETAGSLDVGGPINGNVTSDGDVTLEEDGEVNGELTTDGDLTLNEGSVVNDDVEVNGSVSLAAPINGNLTTTGDVSLNEGGTVETLDTDGNITVNDDGTVYDDVTSAGTVTVTEDGTIHGDVYVDAADDIQCEDGATIDGQPCEEYVDENY